MPRMASQEGMNRYDTSLGDWDVPSTFPLVLNFFLSKFCFRMLVANAVFCIWSSVYNYLKFTGHIHSTIQQVSDRYMLPSSTSKLQHQQIPTLTAKAQWSGHRYQGPPKVGGWSVRLADSTFCSIMLSEASGPLHTVPSRYATVLKMAADQPFFG